MSGSVLGLQLLLLLLLLPLLLLLLLLRLLLPLLLLLLRALLNTAMYDFSKCNQNGTVTTPGIHAGCCMLRFKKALL